MKTKNKKKNVLQDCGKGRYVKKIVLNSITRGVSKQGRFAGATRQ